MKHKLPYGISNFKAVITEGYFYIDKTPYIPKLEEAGKYLFLLRPRRFGKSLFLSMLEYYYGIEYKDEFDILFGKLWIGQNPTPYRNQYPILFMDFSGVDTDGGHDAILSQINQKLDTYLGLFLSRYRYPTTVEQAIQAKGTPANKMEAFIKAMQEAGQSFLLLIDEYDHFANAILAEDLQLFRSIMGKGGFVRAFYEVLKTATQRNVLARMYVTGVTPLMLDSLTSGFNVAKNLSLQPEFNEAMGFTEAEVITLLQPIADACPVSMEQLLADCRDWYNGYRFHLEAERTVYNSDMLLYFVDQFKVVKCSYPERMLDENIASDYGKIMKMFKIGDRDANYAVLDELINQGAVATIQQRKFELDKRFDRDDFISLLGYMGFVTVVSKRLGREVFAIPNHVIRELYFQYFKVELERRNNLCIDETPVRDAIEVLALDGDFEPLRKEAERVLALLSNRDAIWMNEQHIKTLLLTLFYQLPVYFIQSEPEDNKRYPDILLKERSPYEVNFQHLIEVKYSKKGDGQQGWEAKRQEGIAQVQQYLQLPEIAALPKLAAWVLISDTQMVEVVRVSSVNPAFNS